jgi:hypothetical protein
VLLVAQSPGKLSVSVVSTFTGVTGPLLWIVALPETIKAVPTFAVAGLDADAADTLMSVRPEIPVVVLLLVIELFAEVESARWSWSIATEAVEAKLWLEAPVQVTDQEVFTGAPTDCASGVFWTVTGLGLLVVQSRGIARVKVVSAFTGVTGPLLWIVALPLTVKGVPAFAFAGDEADEAVTLMSVRALIPVFEGALVMLSLAELESVTCS